MWALLKSEFLDALENSQSRSFEEGRHVTCVTGAAAYALIKELADRANEKFKGLKVDVVKAENRLFGSSVTVAGLLCGEDIAFALQGKELGEKLIIPAVALKRDEDIFLDDMTLEELGKTVGVAVVPVENDGAVLLDEMLF